MISLPRRGRARRLGLTLRWTILSPTIAEYDAMRLGGVMDRWRVLRRIRRAGILARLFCAREIAVDIIEHIQECAFPEPKGTAGGTGSGEVAMRRFLQRWACEIMRTTGMSPREQYETLTPREWLRLLNHVSWVQSREDSFYASMTSPKVIPPYPDMTDPEQAREADGDRMRQVLAAWTGTRH